MRHAAGMARRAPPGKARHRQIETAPEKMHRARFADKAVRKCFNTRSALTGSARNACTASASYEAWRVSCENGIGSGIRWACCRSSRPGRVRRAPPSPRRRNRHRSSGQRDCRCAVAGRTSRWSMKSKSIWNVRSPSGIGPVVRPRARDIERHVPGMIEPGRERQPDLADDLRPQVQRRIGVAPRRGRQFRPRGLRNVAHAELAERGEGWIVSRIVTSVSRLVHSRQRCVPRVARNRLRQYQRRVKAWIGLRRA